VEIPDDSPGSFGVRVRGPNPFQASTSISYRLASPGVVRIDVVDTQGRAVHGETTSWLAAGEHEWRWNGRDASGRGLAGGVYWCRVSSSEGSRQAVRLLLLGR